MRCSICGSHEHESNSAGCPRQFMATTYEPVFGVQPWEESRRQIRAELLREIHTLMMSRMEPVLYLDDIDRLLAKDARNG